MSVYVLPIFSVGRGTRVLILCLLVGFFWFAPFECNSRRPLNDRPERKDAGCLRPTFAWLGLFSIALSLEYSTCTDNLACKSLANTVGNLTQPFSRIPPVTRNNNSQGRGRRRDTCDHGFLSRMSLRVQSSDELSWKVNVTQCRNNRILYRESEQSEREAEILQ